MIENSFENQLERLSQSYQQKEARESAEKLRRDTLKSQMAKKMQEALTRFISDVLQSDERLFLDERSETPVGLCLSYRGKPNSLLPSFQVSVTCEADMVDVNVSDGNWKQTDGVLGMWADWTDQQQVYSGSLDASTIRKALDAAFLTWYESAIKVGSGRPMP